eukprot:1799890-Prymnesium_polylepis.2
MAGAARLGTLHVSEWSRTAAQQQSAASAAASAAGLNAPAGTAGGRGARVARFELRSIERLIVRRRDRLAATRRRLLGPAARDALGPVGVGRHLVARQLDGILEEERRHVERAARDVELRRAAEVATEEGRVDGRAHEDDLARRGCVRSS